MEFKPYDDPLDSVVATQTDMTPSDVVPATVVRSGDAGWFWQIDTLNYRDWGYVYSSSYTSRETAIKELEDVVGEEISEDRLGGFTFNSGVLDRAWVGNCVAIGNALGFIEPLQSTSIAGNGELTKSLAELLTEHGRVNHRGVRDLYNQYYELQWERLYQFIVCHYKYADGETDFWQDMSDIDLWGPVNYHDQYQLNGLTNHGLYSDRLAPDAPFSTWYFGRLLRGLEVRSSFYDRLDVEVRPEVIKAVDEDRQEVKRSVTEYKLYNELYSSIENEVSAE